MMKKIRLLPIAALAIATTTYSAAASQEGSADSPKPGSDETRRVVHVITSSDETAAGDGPMEIERRFLIVGGGDSADSIAFPSLSHKRGYLGVQLVDLTKELRAHFGVPADAGVMISKVAEDSPAAAAGLAAGDVVTAIDGLEMDSAVRIERTISAASEGTVVNLEIWRDRSVRTVPVKIVERERPVVDLGRIPIPEMGELEDRVWVFPQGLDKHVIRIDPDGLEDALHQLEMRVESPEFLEKFQALGESRLDLQQQILKLEERLKGLERELDRLPKEKD